VSWSRCGNGPPVVSQFLDERQAAGAQFGGLTRGGLKGRPRKSFAVP
jgi:hypothetical protein